MKSDLVLLLGFVLASLSQQMIRYGEGRSLVTVDGIPQHPGDRVKPHHRHPHTSNSRTYVASRGVSQNATSGMPSQGDVVHTELSQVDLSGSRHAPPKTYHGASAAVSVWTPEAEGNDVSNAHMWLHAGSGDQINAIEVGWEVCPSCRNGDSRPHIYVYMTNDSYSSVRCHDTSCHDTFIRTSEEIYLGRPVDGASIVGGRHLRDVAEIRRNADGDWHVYISGQHIGYWPARVLPILSQGATVIGWGGTIGTSLTRRHTRTQMGSGRFSNQGFHRTNGVWPVFMDLMDGVAYFDDLMTIEAGKTRFESVDYDFLRTWITNPNCYDGWVGRRPDDRLFPEGDYRVNFMYGGPGYNPNCLYPAI